MSNTYAIFGMWTALDTPVPWDAMRDVINANWSTRPGYRLCLCMSDESAIAAAKQLYPDDGDVCEVRRLEGEPVRMAHFVWRNRGASE